jgi:hypothetical protein
MSEQYSLSRELAEDELPGDANEALEEARPVHRKPLASGKRASGSEEKPGTEERPSAEPAPAARPQFKTPPFEPPTY